MQRMTSPAMQIFVYELVSGGGLLGSGGPVSAGLLREGAAMRAALVADFAELPGVQVVTTHDVRYPGLTAQDHVVADSRSERKLFHRLAAQADWSVVVAPEFDGLLLERADCVVGAGGRLLGPSPELITLAADKDRTARALQSAGVPVPFGRLLDPGQRLPSDFPYPAVVKPVDGAGSLNVRRVSGSDDPLPTRTGPMRLERFHPGTPASVAVLCGPSCRLSLAPCGQNLSTDGQFRYLGGTVPLPPPLGPRAVALAKRAVAALPDPTGYLGIDLILGAAADGSADVVIEINPRLTTSYIGLRAASDANLAGLMLTIAAGGHATATFRDQPMDFAVNDVV
jgi:predicted ATP-grasp superfamily ATP-dependent carboligase